MSIGVSRLVRIERYVASLDRSVAFYGEALGFRRVAGDDNSALMRLGREELRLRRLPPDASPPSRSPGNDTAFRHFAIVARDITAACAQVRRCFDDPISIEGPIRLPPATGSVTAWKFRDPDGHPLELIAFPPGIGDALWQKASETATLGIDHSAISVFDVQASIAFYRDRLGFSLAARGINHGEEQARLDGLPDPEVSVVALDAGVPTPHLELLGYRHPFPVRGLPHPCSDLLVFAADDLSAVAAAVETEADAGGLTVRDPDGHRLRFESNSGRLLSDEETC